MSLPGKWRCPVGDWNATLEEREAMWKVLESGQLSPGSQVAELEQQFAKKHGCAYGVMTNSGTDALRIALLALKEKFAWPDGSQVYLPALTFVATVNAVLQAGLSPVLTDVSMYDGNMNPDNLLRRLETSPDTSRLKGVLPVHLFGNPCNMNALRDIADVWGLKVIEDACETAGTQVGNWGLAACFSFYMAHLITAGVGGLITTNDPETEKLARSYMNHGRDEDKTGMNRFHFERIGYSSRPTEMQAALALCQLKNLDKTIAQRRKTAWALAQGLTGLPLKLMPFDAFDQSAWMMFPVRCGGVVTRDRLVNHLEFNGIETRPLFSIHDQPCYDGRWRGDFFTVADDWKKTGFYIGCLPDADTDFILKVFLDYDYDEHSLD